MSNSDISYLIRNKLRNYNFEKWIEINFSQGSPKKNYMYVYVT